MPQSEELFSKWRMACKNVLIPGSQHEKCCTGRGGMTPLCTCLRPTNPPTRQSWKKRSPRRLPEQPDGLCLPARAWRYPGPCLRLGAEHTAGDRVEKPDNTRINIIAPEQLFAGGVRIVAISRTQGAFIVYGMQHGGNISTKRQFRTQRLIGIMKPEKSMASVK